MTDMLVEDPVIVVRLIKKVQPIEALDPADFDFDVEVALVIAETAAFAGLLELVHADRISLGNNGPVRWIADDARNLIRGKLKNLVVDSGPFTRQPGDGEREQEHDRPHDAILRHPLQSPIVTSRQQN